MTASNSERVSKEMQTYEVSPYSKSKCLTMLRDAYGPTARIFQRHGLMRLMVGEKEIIQVEGPHTGLPWALVQAGYSRLGFEVFIERGRPFVRAKEREKNDGPDKAVHEVRADETVDELRPVEGQVPAQHVP